MSKFWWLLFICTPVWGQTFTTAQAKILTSIAETMERDAATLPSIPTEDPATMQYRIGLARGLMYSAKALRSLTGVYPPITDLRAYYEGSYFSALSPWKPEPWPAEDERGTVKLLELLK